MMELDALQQRAADNSVARLALLLDAIKISAIAAEMGPGAKSSIASYLRYKTNTVTKLALMYDLPDDCIDLELPLGTYWVALLHADAPVRFLREQAIPEQMSPAEAKRALGVEVVRESRLAKLEAELEQWRALVPKVELLERLARWAETTGTPGAAQEARALVVQEARALAARIREARNDGA